MSSKELPKYRHKAKSRLKWLLSNYYCHRQRGKTHIQIFLEGLSIFLSCPSISTRLMKLTLRRHGLCRPLKLTDILCNWASVTRPVTRDDMLTGCFFVDLRDDSLWACYRRHYERKIQAIIEDADTICRHEFDLLGSGIFRSGPTIDWHLDPLSTYRWPSVLYTELRRRPHSPRPGADIKIPWELSRMQHLPTLGKAFQITKDERYAEEIIHQINDWLDANPCPWGVNWLCPMDVAIRMMNMMWGYQFIRATALVTDEFRAHLAIAIFQHAQFIYFNLEYGIQPNGLITNTNHYLTNIVGLLQVGVLCPEFIMSETWQGVGVKRLIEAMERQVLPDGVNFESSIPYHRLVLELFTAAALLCRRNAIELPDQFWKKLESMFDVVLWVTRPDGKAPQIGDADDGRLYILSDYRHFDHTDFRYLLSIGAVLFQRSDMKAYTHEFAEDAFWLLGPTGIETYLTLKDDQIEVVSKAFRHAGLYVMRQKDRYLLACCGKVGTDGIGNHKHNDLCSFELYVGDKAFIVDPGSYVYRRSPTCRNLFRSTKYHNTVVIDGQEQNRFNLRQLFRMSDDADVKIYEWSSKATRDCLDVAHTGYERLASPVQHRRTFRWDKLDDTWQITDSLIGDRTHRADWYFHFNQGIELASDGNEVFRTCCSGTNLVLNIQSDILVTTDIEEGWISKRYGHKELAQVLHISGSFNTACHMIISISVM